MPYPAQVNREQIIETAHRLFEQEGVDAVSMAQLAAALGIKAPSLYRHLADRTALFKGVNTLTYQRLTSAMRVSGSTPYEKLQAMAHAYRAFALANPVTYALAFDSREPDAQPERDLLEALAQPLQAAFAEVIGESDGLVALRGAWALLHGFVSLETGAHFKRSGDVGSAFDTALNAYLAGWGIQETLLT